MKSNLKTVKEAVERFYVVPTRDNARECKREIEGFEPKIRDFFKQLTVKICKCMDKEENESTSELTLGKPADCGLSELLEWVQEQRDKEIFGE